MKAVIRVGIGGWTYEPWRGGTFYPQGLAQSRELEYASRKLTSIEINGTYYVSQKPASFRRWHEETPDGFVFSVKGPRFATNRRVLAEATPTVERFFASGVLELKEKLGPILWQFAARRKFDLDDVAAFIDLLPDELDGRKVRHAIEPRHDSFQDHSFFDLCRARNVAVVFEDSDDYPCIEADTADFTYARLQRMREDIPTGYDAAALEGFAGRARGWSAGGRDSYVFMINGAKVRAPAAAQALQERIV